MDVFEQCDATAQEEMMYKFIDQTLITDGYIAYQLGLLKCSVQSIRAACGGNKHEMARRLVFRVRFFCFFKHHWGKVLVGAGVGTAAIITAGLYGLNQIVLN